MTQRQEIIERLNGLEMEGGSHEMLSAICKAVLPHDGAWTLRRCADLRDRLVRLLGEADTPHSSDGRITDELRNEVEQLRRESVATRLRMAQHGGYDGSTGFVRRNVYQLFGVDEKGYDSVYFLVGNIATEVEREIASAKSAAYDQGYAAGYDAGFASADDWCAQHEDAMAEHGWIHLPLGEDGEYIHVGDAVTCGATVWTVTGLKFLGEGWGICCTVYNEYGGSGTSVYPPSDLRHYHAPTVEDVLTEFAAKLIERGELTNGAAQTIAEYAKRLRLAGDAE